MPYPYTVGSLLRFNNDSSYWVFNVVGNWASRYRRFAHEDVVAQQSVLEGLLFESQVCLVWYGMVWYGRVGYGLAGQLLL